MISADLAQPVVLSLLGGGFVAAALHAALPTHWLPFVLVGRAQGWGMRKVSGTVILAALAHVLTTALVGGVVAVAGVALDRWVHGVLPHLSSALLFLFGAFYLARYWHRTTVPDCKGCEHDEPKVSDRAAFWGLIALMAASPGEVLLPLYLTTATHGAGVFLALSAGLALGTIAGMLVLTSLAMAGYSVLRLERWARYEGVVLGASLIVLGFVMAFHPV
ncbi:MULTISPECIES: hypothetical protein [unclassified Brevundimonas]|uniref:hypothetical protein n=1 Tax=unclassified Brevundimonas TaxID=2622653 RepID=UPI0025BC2B02|nr:MULTISPECIES: hypothetical protein [unclassified Brevundimonas]